jgi:hypothetical protein
MEMFCPARLAERADARALREEVRNHDVFAVAVL